MSGCMALIYLLVGRESSVFYRVVLAVSDLPCVTGPNQHIDLAATSEMASARLSCFQLANTTEAEMHFQFRCYRTPLYQAVLSDAKFHAQLLVFDRDLSAA